MDRREFLKRLGFFTASLPLVGFKPKEDEVPDIIEIEAVTPDEEVDEPEYFDQPYHSDAAWVSAVWLSAPSGGFTLRHGDDTIIDNCDLGLDDYITTGKDED